MPAGAEPRTPLKFTADAAKRADPAAGYNSAGERGGERWICSRNSASRITEAAAAQIPVIDFGPLFCRRARRARPPRAGGAPRLREGRVLLRAEPRRARGADRARLRRLAPLSRAAARRKAEAQAQREQYRLPADQRLGAGRLDRAQGDTAEPERELFHQPRPRRRSSRRGRRQAAARAQPVAAETIPGPRCAAT